MHTEDVVRAHLAQLDRLERSSPLSLRRRDVADAARLRCANNDILARYGVNVHIEMRAMNGSFAAITQLSVGAHAH